MNSQEQECKSGERASEDIQRTARATDPSYQTGRPQVIASTITKVECNGGGNKGSGCFCYQLIVDFHWKGKKPPNDNWIVTFFQDKERQLHADGEVTLLTPKLGEGKISGALTTMEDQPLIFNGAQMEEYLMTDKEGTFLNVEKVFMRSCNFPCIEIQKAKICYRQSVEVFCTKII